MSTTFFFSSTMRWRKYSVFFLRTPKFDRVLPSLGTYVMSLFMSFPLSERIFRLRLDWTSSSSVQNVRLISGAQTVAQSVLDLFLLKRSIHVRLYVDAQNALIKRDMVFATDFTDF